VADGTQRQRRHAQMHVLDGDPSANALSMTARAPRELWRNGRACR
jgi:hypothetical protein